MKYLPHVGFPLLMVLLLAGAVILPRFVKKQAPAEPNVSEMSYEELKATLVESGAIEDIPESTLNSEPIAPVAAAVADASKPAVAKVAAVAPAISIDDQLAPFFKAVENKKFTEAREKLTALGSKIPTGMIGGLKATVASAEASEKALVESQKKLQATNAELASSRDRFAKIESDSIKRIESSVKNLEAATAAAQKAASEAEQLRAKMNNKTPAAPAVVGNAAAAPATIAPTPKKAIKLPKTASVTFAYDSSYVSTAMGEIIKTAIGEMKKESGLKLQLRGHADKRGDVKYNAILSRARAESVKDKLIEAGIAEKRIEIISFGESQSAVESDAAKLRRVDLVFRAY